MCNGEKNAVTFIGIINFFSVISKKTFQNFFVKKNIFFSVGGKKNYGQSGWVGFFDPNVKNYDLFPGKIKILLLC